MKFCLDCSEKLNNDVNICPKCGFNYSEFMRTGIERLKQKKKKRVDKLPIFSEEECFLMGIHPDDEMYRKIMELDILTKNYKR